ncbi:MAG: GreA/GreB family elongation factor [Flavobacteriales bacterium]
MSRGFVREDDQEEAPFIPPRAPLPDGVTNYVTSRGMALLMEERKSLEAERSTVQRSDEVARRHELAVINGKLDLLNERIGSARIVEPGDAPPDDVRFGTTVTFKFLSGPQQGAVRTFTLVGVDEASVAEQRIAFTAPIARALLGTRAGDVAPFHLGAATQQLEVLSIA